VLGDDARLRRASRGMVSGKVLVIVPACLQPRCKPISCGTFPGQERGVFQLEIELTAQQASCEHSGFTRRM
jgi:hypothetical protein